MARGHTINYIQKVSVTPPATPVVINVEEVNINTKFPSTRARNDYTTVRTVPSPTLKAILVVRNVRAKYLEY